MAAIEPMNQFMIHKIVEIPPVQVGGISIDMSITNSVAFMMFSAALITVFFLSAARGAVVPGRLQAFAETLYDLVDKGLTGPMIGDRGRPFLPFVFTLFSMIAVMNIIGLAPGSFTVTSQLAVTATLAVMTFLIVVIVGFMRNGFGFFKLFMPSGVGAMVFFLAPIEFISFMVRPVTLAMRLFGNMIGGHVVMYMFASFIIGLGLFAIHTGGAAYLGFVGSALSLAMVVALMSLEFIVAFLQAFVFAALTCTYLSDVVNLDHGH
jgi:F-type H+-transporting ATPase subunit a